MNATACQTCRLSLAACGAAEPCPRERCAFWEDGGTALEGACVLERLGVDLGRPDLAAHLLDLRDRLREARDLRDEQAARGELARRIGLEL